MAVYLLCYAASCLFAGSEHYYLSGMSLMAAAIYLYYMDYKATGCLLHLRGVFSLSWVGGQGLACMKLSKLSPEWSFTTWICFLAAYLGFYVVFGFMNYYLGEIERERSVRRRRFRGTGQPVFFSICGIALISFACFLLEAASLGYVPLFLKGVPHAYSYFHLTGIHYFTVSCVLVPALSVVWFCTEGNRRRSQTWAVAFMNVLALLIPVLCVSRFQTLMAVILAVLTYILTDSRMRLVYVAGALAALVPVYLILTAARSHDVTYLNSIFEMKNSRMPIFITQPYMYIANNYDNFNCLTEGLTSHSLGLKMLTPLWTLSGLKFVFPSLVDFPLYVNKEELTTLTIVYDAYYDFGVLGVAGFSGILGAVSYWLMRMKPELKNPAGYLLYAQVAMYFLFSFFTTWFSNPTTWFYFAVTAAAAFAVDRKWGAGIRL